MRTGVSALGCVLPEKDDHNPPGARDIADRLMASLGSMLLYWYHYRHNGKRIEVETDDDSHRRPLPASAARRAAVRDVGARDAHVADPVCRARVQRVDVHRARDRRHRRGHVFGDHRRASARCAGRSTAAPTKSRSRSRSATQTPDEAEADIRARVANKEVVIGFGHPVYTIADPRNKVIKEVAQQLSKEARRQQDVRHRRAHRDGDVGREEDVPEPRLVQRGQLSHDGRADGDVHAAVRHLAHVGLGARTSSSSASTTRSSARARTTPDPRI